MLLLNCKESIVLKDGSKRDVRLYFGGRYYSSKHKYNFNDPLSLKIQKFKYQYINSFDLFFSAACRHINKTENIDCLTYIPLKPKDKREGKFDRFNSLQLTSLKNKDNIYLETTLKIIKDFSQKGNDLYVRKEIVKETFKVVKNVNNKVIVIIDDVFTTGSTIFEASKVLYEAGAKKVIALILAVNQPIESSINYKNLICGECGNDMILKISKNGKLFFGCENYKNHKNNSSQTIDLLIGIERLKENNRLVKVDILDLEEEF